MSLPKLRDLPAILARTVQPTRGRMNLLEGRYAKRLEARLRAGEVAAFWYEAIKFRLADGSWYTPDFFVILASGHAEIHETKGFMRESANVRLKVTSELFWVFPVLLVTEKRGIFTIREVGR